MQDSGIGESLNSSGSTFDLVPGK